MMEVIPSALLVVLRPQLVTFDQGKFSQPLANHRFQLLEQNQDVEVKFGPKMCAN